MYSNIIEARKKFIEDSENLSVDLKKYADAYSTIGQYETANILFETIDLLKYHGEQMFEATNKDMQTMISADQKANADLIHTLLKVEK